MKIDDRNIGIDTMGYQDEPAEPKQPPTAEEKIADFDLCKCLQAVYSMDGGCGGVCDDIARDDDVSQQINYSLHLGWDADEEPERVSN